MVSAGINLEMAMGKIVLQFSKWPFLFENMGPFNNVRVQGDMIPDLFFQYDLKK